MFTQVLVEQGVAGSGAMDCERDWFSRPPAEPALRLYTWAAPAISYGRGQDPAGILDLGACRREGIPIIERPAGGGVVFHGGDACFGLVVPRPGERGADSLRLWGNWWARWVVSSLRQAGVGQDDLEIGAAGTSGRSRAPLCQDRPSPHEVLVRGHKVSGLAFRITRRVLLLQGFLAVRSVPRPELLRHPESNLPAASILQIEPEDMLSFMRYGIPEWPL